MKGGSGKKGEKPDSKKKKDDKKSKKSIPKSHKGDEHKEPKKELNCRRTVDKDRKAIIQDYIPQTKIYCTDPFAFAILFKAKDVPAIIQGCDLLYEYISKNPEFGEELVQKGVVEDLLTGMRDPYPYLNGARYRFLSKLYQMYPQTRKEMEADKEFLRMAAMDAARTNDTPLRAYALLYCYWVSPNIPGMLKELIDKYGVNRYFCKFLIDPDVDVKNNSLGMMKNMLVYDWAAKRIINCDLFSFTHLVDMMGCPYPDIQNKALDVIYELVRRTERERYVHKKFRRASGVDILFQLLNVFQWRDIHDKVLKILRVIFQNFCNLKTVQQLNGILRLSNYVSYILDQDLVAADLKTMLSICNTYEGKMIMMKENPLDVFIEVLQDGSQEAKIQASEGIRILSGETFGLLKLITKDPSKMLLKMIHNDKNSMELRSNCACTLNALARSSPISRRLLVRGRTFAKLVKLLEQPLVLPADSVCMILETISSVLSNALQMSKILTHDLTENVMAFLDNYEPEMKKLHHLAPEVLAWTLEREVGRDWFVGLSGVSKIMKLLYQSSDPVLLNNLGLLLRMAVEKDDMLTETFIRNDIIKWLMDNDNLWQTCPRLETVAETIFTLNLSVKLEYWGRLETTDIVTDGFYCSRFGRMDQFPLATDLAMEHVCPLRPVYFVAIGGDNPFSREDSRSLIHFGKNEEKARRVNVMSPQLSAYSKKLIDAKKNNSLDWYGCDLKLRDLYLHLKDEVESLPTKAASRMNKYCRQWVVDCSRIIGETVARTMSGRFEEPDCGYHTFELHIQELKVRLSSSLIPLGELEVGQKLERAVLFKVLADRLGLPTALVRGHHATAWVEVPLPSGDTLFFNDLPPEKMVTTHLVDLVSQPGQLVRLDTTKAAIYCGTPVAGIRDKMPRHITGETPYWITYKNKQAEPIKYHVEIC